MLGDWLERQAEKFLIRRGRVVLSRYFVGAAFGYAAVTRRKHADGVTLTAHLPAGSDLVVLNNTVVQNH